VRRCGSDSVLLSAWQPGPVVRCSGKNAVSQSVCRICLAARASHGASQAALQCAATGMWLYNLLAVTIDLRTLACCQIMLRYVPARISLMLPRFADALLCRNLTTRFGEAPLVRSCCAK
jgi:hypothetical protein